MSRRDRDTERDRRAAASARTNEYFVPQDGIDREVITADICRYLGNDALVRPGKYENPQTRQVQAGYFINAYRNLTTAMIADLKADSERWEAERRQTASRGPANVGYRDSNTHQTRQYYGPSEAVQTSSGYPSSNSTGTPLGSVYDGTVYQQQYAQPASGYAQPPGYPIQDSYYVAGADLVADQSRSSRGVPVTSVNVPRSNTYAAAAPTYQQPDSRSAYYAGPPPPVTQTQQQVFASPQDPYYGRAVPVTGASYDTQDAYDSRSYQDSGYSQAASSSSIPATSNTSSRREQREPDRDSRGHRSHGGRR
jgi:hypothetical protein